MPIVPAPSVTAGCGCRVCSHPCGTNAVMHRDIVHVPGPNQQRIRRIGGALVAVAAALDHEAQVIFAGKIYRRGNVLGISCRDRVDAWLGSPRVDPSQGLREPGLIADVVRIFQVLRSEAWRRRCRIGFEYRKREVDRNQISADRIIELLPRRRRWPCGIGRTAPAEIRTRPRDGAAKSAGAPPIRLLSGMLFCSLTLFPESSIFLTCGAAGDRRSKRYAVGETASAP